MISKNGIALVVLVVEGLLSAIGIEFEPGTVAKAVEGVVVAGSIILMVVNQLNREDVEHFVLKKQSTPDQ